MAPSALLNPQAVAFQPRELTSRQTDASTRYELSSKQPIIENYGSAKNITTGRRKILRPTAEEYIPQLGLEKLESRSEDKDVLEGLPSWEEEVAARSEVAGGSNADPTRIERRDTPRLHEVQVKQEDTSAGMPFLDLAFEPNVSCASVEGFELLGCFTEAPSNVQLLQDMQESAESLNTGRQTCQHPPAQLQQVSISALAPFRQAATPSLQQDCLINMFESASPSDCASIPESKNIFNPFDYTIVFPLFSRFPKRIRKRIWKVDKDWMSCFVTTTIDKQFGRIICPTAEIERNYRKLYIPVVHTKVSKEARACFFQSCQCYIWVTHRDQGTNTPTYSKLHFRQTDCLYLKRFSLITSLLPQIPYFPNEVFCRNVKRMVVRSFTFDEGSFAPQTFVETLHRFPHLEELLICPYYDKMTYRWNLHRQYAEYIWWEEYEIPAEDYDEYLEGLNPDDVVYRKGKPPLKLYRKCYAKDMQDNIWEHTEKRDFLIDW